jgi:hypothetical protein
MGPEKHCSFREIKLNLTGSMNSPRDEKESPGNRLFIILNKSGMKKGRQATGSS